MSADQEKRGSDRDFVDTVRSTLLVGGGAALTMAIGIVRTKFVAALIGPSGVALFAVFNQIAEVFGAATSFGLGTSGVREIASAHAEGAPEKLARTVKTLRRTTWCTGLLGLLIMVFGSRLVSNMTFGGTAQAVPIAMLGLVVLVRALTTGQSCIVRGTRRLNDFVRINIGGAIGALVASVLCVFIWGTEGIVPGMVLAAMATLGVSWWYSRRIEVAPIEHSWQHTRVEARELLRFGLPIMLMGLVGTITPYFERVVLLRTIGLNDLGQYQAAYALTGVVTSFVITAMTADSYPKLVGMADDPVQMGKEVNGQIEASMLMSIPGVLCLFSLAPLVVPILYSREFAPAVEVLRITTLGVIGRLIAWPLRLAFMAKGMGGTVLGIEIGASIIGLGLLALLTPPFGLRGAGWAFVASNLIIPIAMVALIPWLAGIRVTAKNLLYAVTAFLAVCGLVVNVAITTSLLLQWTISGLVTITGCLLCARTLSQRTGWNLNRVLRRFRGDPASGKSSL
jgi:PST family polysaccharide transporter